MVEWPDYQYFMDEEHYFDSEANVYFVTEEVYNKVFK